MRQLSLLELHRLRDPAASDASHVARIAADVIAELAERPPVSLEVVASYRGIGEIRLEPSLPFAGSLTPEPGRLVMRLREADGPRRRRFTGFHEVGHTFQPGYHDAPSFRCENPQALRRREHVEALADVASTELLLPRSFFVADVRSMAFGFDSITELADRYESSIEATALRYVALRPTPTLLIVLSPGLRKSERHDPDAIPVLRVNYSAASGAWPFVPRNKSAAPDGPLHRALLGEIVDERGQLVDLGIDAPSCRFSVRSFPVRDGHGVLQERVLALYEPVANRRDRRAP